LVFEEVLLRKSISNAVPSVQQGSDAKKARALSTNRRIWEVDAWRGIAITTMVIFHLMWDLYAFAGLGVVLHRGFWFYFQRFTAISFITLVGISLVISYHRSRQSQNGTEGLFWRFFQRGAKILGIAMIITLVVRLSGVGRIDYGVLHLIGTSVILAYPFLRFRWLNLLFAGIFFAASYAIQEIPVDTYAFVWLGLQPPGYYYLDYFPLVHWFAVVLIGVFIGNTLYTNGERQFSLPDYSPFFPFNLLQFLGRHSLLIYVIHQPILIAVLFVLGIARFNF
jgi:uncharacterized membrane protein